MTRFKNTSPRPWKVQKCPCGNAGCRAGVVEPFIVHGQGSCDYENAELIVAAVNAYDAHRNLEDAVRHAVNLIETPKRRGCLDYFETDRVLRVLREAIRIIDETEKSNS